ncbi:MAG: hypothetical protein QXK89_10075 [Candidatus Bathyarchaeia archaeon]
MSESNVAVEDFKRKWKDMISKIEKEAIDGEGVTLIRLNFRKDKLLFEIDVERNEFTHEMFVELEILESELEAALQIANSKFKLENRRILARIFGGIFELISQCLQRGKGKGEID